MCYLAKDGPEGMETHIGKLCQQAKDSVLNGYNILILSDRSINEINAAIPALLATSAVHHFLIREGLRTESGLVIETGEARQVHDFCLLAGYGAEAINPYLAFDTITDVSKKSSTGSKVLEQRHAKSYVKDGYIYLSIILRSADI